MTQNSPPGGNPKLIGLKDPVKDKEVVCAGIITMGRDPTSNSFPLTHPSISRKHARVYLEGSTWVVEDLNSSNGVFLNDSRVEKAKLKEGDVVKIGEVPFKFTQGIPPRAAAAPTADGFEPTLMMAPAPGAKPKQAELPSDFEGTVFGGQAPSFFVDAIKKEPQAAEAPRGGAAAAAPQVYAAPRTDDVPNLFLLKLKAAAILGSVVLAALLGIWLLVRSQSRGEELRKKVKEVRQQLVDFQEEFESKALDEARIPEAFKGQLEILGKHDEGVKEALEKFSGGAAEQLKELKQLKEKFGFLIFERKFELALLEHHKAGAEKVVHDLQANGTDAQKDLVPLARFIVDYRLFLDTYPLRPDRSETAPERKEVEKLVRSLNEWKSEYVKYQSNSIKSLCEYFTGMADKIRDSEIRFLEWDRFWGDFEQFEKAPAGSDKKDKLETLKSKYPNLKLIKDLK